MPKCPQIRPGPNRAAMACAVVAALLVAHHPVVDAQQAGAANSPPLVVFAQPRAGADQAPLPAGAAATLETIQSDPAASGIRIGRSNPEPVLATRALSLALPSASDACANSGQSTIGFTDIEVRYNEDDLVSLYARDDATDAEISLVIQGPDVLGSVRCGDEIYKITPLGDGTTAVYEFDTSRLRQHPPGWGTFIQDSWTDIEHEGELDEDGQAPGPAARDPTGAPGAARDPGDEIDVLIAYTPAARVEAGNISAFIQSAIDASNRVYANSNIGLRLRVVDTYEVSYTQDADMEVDLERLTFRRDTVYTDTGRRPDPDGYMDEIHDRRDQHGADLVALFVGREADNTCGIAWIPDPARFPAFDWSRRGFSVTAQNCEALGTYTFTHELGHNQGGAHNPPYAGFSAFPHGHGFCNTAGDWRTVMSYSDNGEENGEVPCRARKPYFSSPMRLYMGRPTGDATTHDNRRVLRETQVRVANYRASKGPTTLTLPLVPPATNIRQQGFVRIINNSNRAGEVKITAIDDGGLSFGPISLSLEPRAAAHFNSQELENGSPEKGLSGGVGDGTGDWRLELTTDLEIEHLAYIRTADGFVTAMHEVAAEAQAGSNRYHVPFLNPGKNRNQVGKLRVINPGNSRETIEITGVDDEGRVSSGTVRLILGNGTARTLTASELENGSPKFSGRLGAGEGKWRLSVSADRPVMVMSLLELPQGHLTNLSRGQPGVSVPLPPASNDPDLVVQSPSVDDSTLAPGQTFRFSATVRNQGGASAAATRLHVHRSADATIATGDAQVASAPVGAIAASGSEEREFSLTAPSADGAYYYGACVDPVSGESNTGNNCSTAVPVAVRARVSYWGAIVTGWDGPACAQNSDWYWYARWNRRDRDAATSDALSACRSDGLRECTARVEFDQCGALAIGGFFNDCDLFGGSGPSRIAAERRALETCGRRYRNCRTPVGFSTGNPASYCNTGAGASATADGEGPSLGDVGDTPPKSEDSGSGFRARPAPQQR